MKKITPFLWFNDNAEEAANYYCSIFKNSKINSIGRYGEAGPGPKGSVMSVIFELDGQEFFALNGGPMYKFTEAISFYVDCKTQEEIDELWEKLSAGGSKIMCGWVTDKFGLTWQVVPSVLQELLGSKDPKVAGNVMQVMMKMTKLDIKALQAAAGK
jgi:predicted 3-demethylubiquinone-9 3-methyltransferase (glyoxalase superfamily)